tara:strand:- start:3 stop:1235 length:1233 start_codon:yes stop_codon:yes gene_type:complete
MSRPKVLYLLGNLSGGGAEYTFLEFARFSQQFDSSVFAFSVNGELSDEFSEVHRHTDGVHHYLGASAHFIPRNLYGIYNKWRKRRWSARCAEFCRDFELDLECSALINPSMVGRLHSLIERVRPDVVVTSMMDIGGSFAMSVALHSWDVKPKWVVWEANYPQAKFDDWGLVKTTPQQIFTSFYASADRVIACSKGIAQWLVASGGVDREKVTTIYNGLRASFRTNRRRTFDPAVPVFVSVGRLHRQKRHDLTIRAFKRVAKVYPNSQLYVLGEGADRQALERLVDDLGLCGNVRMPGHVDTVSLLLRATGFVLASDYEGYPNVLLEAMGLGVPCIATDCPTGPSEMIQTEGEGILLPLGDEMALAEAMLTFVRSPELADQVGENARSWARNRAIEDTARDFEEVYSEVLA